MQAGAGRVAGDECGCGGVPRGVVQHSYFVRLYDSLIENLVYIYFAVVGEIKCVAGLQLMQKHKRELLLTWIENIIAGMSEEGRIARLARHNGGRVMDDAVLQRGFYG